MPISSIIEQPLLNSLNAVYRPIVFKARATRTDGNAQPPVVYCDIYINGVFYRSIEKTQYFLLGGSSSDWFFDISDSCQEVLVKQIPVNGVSQITQTNGMIATVFCKFRSSGYDINNFIAGEGTAPVQGTGSVAPVSGTGTQSNSIFILNSTLQHDQNQSIAAHLGYYRNSFWAADCYPLTHRRNGYRVCQLTSDVFPIVTINGSPDCLRLNYRLRGSAGYTQTGCGGTTCVAVAIIGTPTMPNAVVGVPYSFSITVSGNLPININSLVRPLWLNVTPNGNRVDFTGTPTATATGVQVRFNITNCGGANSVPFIGTFDITAACVAPTYTATTLPDAVVGTLYSANVPLHGTTPYNFTMLDSPTWMSGSIVGTNAHLTGTPDVNGTNLTVSFKISNPCGNVTFTDHIDSTNTGAHLDFMEFVNSNATSDREIAHLSGAPGSVLSITLDSLTNTNGGIITFAGTEVHQGDVMTVTLDGSGLAEVMLLITGTILGHPSTISAHFTITASTIGGIGSPATFTISKAFS